MNKDLISIGKILKTHGIKGNLYATFYSKNAFSEYKNFFDKNGREIELKIVSQPVENKTNDSMTTNFKSIVNINKTANCNDAMKYLGFEIFIKKSQIQKDENEFLISDLLGLKVFDFNNKNKNLGIVKDVHDFGGGIIIEISFDKKYTEFSTFTMLPFDDNTFPEIDCKNQTIYLNFSPEKILSAVDENDPMELSDDDIELISHSFEKYMNKVKKA